MNRAVGWTLFFACLVGSIVALALVLMYWDPTHKGPVKVEGDTPEVRLGKVIAEGGDIKEIEKILDKEPSLLNKRGLEGKRPLDLAVVHKRLDVVRLLLDLRADVKGADETGVTAMHLAAGVGDVKVMELLAAKGADLTARTNKGETVAQRASASGSVAALQWLEKQGIMLEEPPKQEMIFPLLDDSEVVFITSKEAGPVKLSADAARKFIAMMNQKPDREKRRDEPLVATGPYFLVEGRKYYLQYGQIMCRITPTLERYWSSEVVTRMTAALVEHGVPQKKEEAEEIIKCLGEK